MGSCPKCGAGNQTERFCGNCGAPLQAPTAAGQMTPPSPPGGYSPPTGGYTPPAGGYTPPPQAPNYSQPQPTPQPYGQSQPYNQPNPYGHQAPPYAPPARKSRAGLWVGLGVAVIALGVLVVLLLPSGPDDPPSTPPNPPATTAGTTTPPVSKPPEPSSTATNTTPAPATTTTTKAAIEGTGLKQMGSGAVNYNFVAYDWLTRDTITVASNTDKGFEVAFLGFKNGKLEVLRTSQHALGPVRDITFGSEVENGQNIAYVVGDGGLAWVNQNGTYSWVEDENIRRVYVGDFDGDGKSERVTFREKNGAVVASATRYKSITETEQLAEFSVTNLPSWTGTTLLMKDKRRMLVGVDNNDEKSVKFSLYSMDFVSGLKVELSSTLPSTEQAELLSASASMIDGKPTVVASYLSNPSYIQLLDIANGTLTPRGRITLPDNDAYYAVVGTYGTSDQAGILAITPEGKWNLYSN